MNTPEHDTEETAHSNPIFSILGAIGSILIFVFILILAYLPLRPESADAAAQLEREQRFAEHQAKEKSLAETYRWVNEPDGVVRIPVERAMQLKVERINAEGGGN